MRSRMFKSSTATAKSTTAKTSNKAKSIRGTISAPIPITAPSDEEEFPIRQPGTGIASPVPTLSQAASPRPTKGQVSTESWPPPPSPPMESVQQHDVQPMGRNASPPRAEVTQTVQDGGGSPRSVKSMTGLKHSSPQKASRIDKTASSPGVAKHRRTNTLGTQRFSTVSGASTSLTGESGRPQRKQSTLRSTIGKIFGRKRKGTIGSIPESEFSFAPSVAKQHRSVPATRKVSPTHGQDGSRTTSMPVTEFDRALRSHSIGLEDITAIRSARNSAQMELGHSRERSAPTILTSHLYTRPRREGEDWIGLSPRPASVHGRTSRHTELTDNPEEIGIAITSDMAGEPSFNSRRRSRSLSGMPEIGAGSYDGARRRSDEIRYWRQSYGAGPLSPISSAFNGGADTVEEHENQERESFTTPRERAQDVTPPETPPAHAHAFAFGSGLPLLESPGKKISQAASTDLRLGSLEARMKRVEGALGQIYNTTPADGTLLEPSDSYRQTAKFQTTAANRPSFGFSQVDEPNVLSIYETSQKSTPQETNDDANPLDGSATQDASSAMGRSMSGSTIRPAHSMPSMDRPAKRDSIAHLLSQLHAERLARQPLEHQVQQLSAKVDSLSAHLMALLADHHAASKSHQQTPVRGKIDPRSQLRPVITQLATPPSDLRETTTNMAITPSHLAPLQTFDLSPTPKAKLTQPASSSVFEDESDASPITAESEADMFETPGEELNMEDLTDEEDGSRGGLRHGIKGLRTISLSQMTTGKMVGIAQI